MRKIATVIGALVVLSVCKPDTACADWQFTRWGMSADELNHVWEGLTKLTPKEAKGAALDDKDLEPQYRGHYEASGIPMSATLYFRRGGLALISLTADKPEQGTSSAIFSLLERTYGPPASKKSEWDTQRVCMLWSAEWKDVAGGNWVRFFSYNCIAYLKLKASYYTRVSYQSLAPSKDTGF
jgi:hypothetical protein